MRFITGSCVRSGRIGTQRKNDESEKRSPASFLKRNDCVELLAEGLPERIHTIGTGRGRRKDRAVRAPISE